MAPNDPNSYGNNYANSNPSTDSQTPANWPGVPYRMDHTSDPAQMAEFGGALQQTLARLSALRNPSAISAQSSSPTPPQPGGQSSMPDYSSLLRMYGVSQPTIRQSPFLSNDFMQAHPVLGGALNNALTAAALTPDSRGPSGAGSGISRTLQGVMGVQPYMQQYQMQQQEAPLQYAEALSKLYGSNAQAQMMQAHANYFNSMPGERAESAQMRYLAQQQKLGQPVHTSDGRLLGYIGADGFQSTTSLGIPDEANVNKPGSNTPRYNIEAYTQALVDDSMTKRFGSDQTKWPTVPTDVWNGAIDQAQNRFKVIPQDAINASRQGEADTRWRATTQLSIQRMLEGEQARINARYDKTVNDPIIKFNDEQRLKTEANRKGELQDAQQRAQQLQDTLLGPQQSQGSQQPSARKGSKGKATPVPQAANSSSAQTPQRPANVPPEYNFDANGSQGAGWYKPTR